MSRFVEAPRGHAPFDVVALAVYDRSSALDESDRRIMP